MPIPALSEHGFLPPGWHDCTLQEVEVAFCGNPHRAALLDNFLRFLEWLQAEHGLQLPYYVDGSYTTAKALPSDIDFIIDLSAANQAEIGRALTLYGLHRPQIKRLFNVDFLAYHPDASNDLREYFQYVRIEELNQRKLPQETRKGILRIVP